VALASAAAIVVAADGEERGAPAPRGAGGWGSLAPSIFSRTEVGAGRIGGRIYVVGGFVAGGGTTGKMARYDISSDRWKRMPDLPIAVNHAGVTSLRGKLYVLGGNWPARGQNAKSPRLYRFTPKRKRWLRLPDAPTARGALGLVGRGRKLFAVGGSTKSNERLRKLETFSVKRKRWRRGPKLPTGRNHIGVAILGGRLYVTGGRPGPENGGQTTVESYSLKSREWRMEPSLDVARSGHATVAVGGGLVASEARSSAFRAARRSSRWSSSIPMTVCGRRCPTWSRRATALAESPKAGACSRWRVGRSRAWTTRARSSTWTFPRPPGRARPCAKRPRSRPPPARWPGRRS
jgi:Kelch motif